MFGFKDLSTVRIAKGPFQSETVMPHTMRICIWRERERKNEAGGPSECPAVQKQTMGPAQSVLFMFQVTFLLAKVPAEILSILKINHKLPGLLLAT